MAAAAAAALAVLLWICTPPPFKEKILPGQEPDSNTLSTRPPPTEMSVTQDPEEQGHRNPLPDEGGILTTGSAGHAITTPPDFTEYRIGKNSSVYQTLRKAGLNPTEVHRLVEASEQIYDLSRVQKGVLVRIYSRLVGGPEPARIFYKTSFTLSITESLNIIRNEQGVWEASMHSKPITVKTESFQGQVKSSLWRSATSAGLAAEPVYALTDILAWQIDFDREVRPGDHWRILVDRNYVEGTPAGWGSIIIAEYQRGQDKHTAIRYPPDGDGFEYYTPGGESVKGRFLKSPLRYSRISSGFQRQRFHPILGVNRPHYGVDYAAPTGTPVRAVGDGIITSLGRRGGNGKMIRIRHNSTYETAYKHLHGYKKGLRKGSKVHQGDVIAYVGSTGLATGPHLHFEFYENGRFTDPLGRKFPREDPIPPKDMEGFRHWVVKARSRLEAREPLSLSGTHAPTDSREDKATKVTIQI